MKFSKLLKLINESLILEGQAGGHMWHPFDIPSVKTGKDLIDVFYKVVDSLAKSPGTLKVDGVNFAFRVIKRKNGKYEFVRDGGSSKPLDILGVGVDDMNDRWPNDGEEEHGLATVGKVVLSNLNDNIDKMLPLLKKLNVVCDEGVVPCRMINAEYIDGRLNTQDYSEMDTPKFLSLHNILETDWKDDNKKTRVKPYEVEFDNTALNELALMMNSALSILTGESKMSVYAPQEINVSKEEKEEIKKKLDEALDSKYTIKIDDNSKTLSLREWLEDSKNPRDKIRKDPYMNSLNGIDASDPINNPKNYDLQIIIDSIIFYHATRVLGKTILKYVDFDNSNIFGDIIVGDAQKHEGIVINDKSISPEPFKLTGDFLVTNVTDSNFKKKKNAVKESRDNIDKWCFFVGSFKPPHRGHFEAILNNIDKIDGDGKFVVIISEPKREESIRSKHINANVAKRVFKLYCDKYGIAEDKIKLYTSSELMQDENIIAAIKKQNDIPDVKRKTSVESLASPVIALKFFIDSYVKSDDVAYLFRGDKDDNSMSMFDFIIKGREDVKFKTIALPTVYMKDDKTPLSATALRDAIAKYKANSEDEKSLSKFLPSKISVEEFIETLSI